MKVHLKSLLSMVIMFCLTALYGQDNYLRKFPVEGGKHYQLTFSAEGDKSTRWVVHLHDADGNLPYDGALEYAWQHLETGQKRYVHQFLSVETAKELRFAFRSNGKMPELHELKLEEIHPPEMLINGDFELGKNNYSGWNDNHWVDIQASEEGNQLFVQQNGYALSDYTPVISEAGYNIAPKVSPHPSQVLAYDRNRRLIQSVPQNRRKSPHMQVPKGAAYVRFLYVTWHDHLPAYRTRTVSKAGLVPFGDSAPSALEVPSPVHNKLEIIIGAAAEPREVYAARELRYWTSQITGRTPPLLAKPSTTKNVKIHVGRQYGAGYPEDAKWLEESDGYAVRRKGDDIYVFADRPRGVIFAVHALLERNSDIIWPRYVKPFEAIWTPQPGLAFETADFRSKPAFGLRQISLSGKGYTFDAWLARNGASSTTPLHTGLDYLAWERGAEATYGGSHLNWLKDAKDKDETLYPLVDGTRSKSRWRQPCYTHPDAAKIIAANIRKALERVPEPARHVSSIISDNWTVCACPRCMEPIQLPDGTQLKPTSPYSSKDSLFFSTRNFMMLNKVAEYLAKDYPKLRIITHAYIFTAEPPRVKLHPMIVPQFAAYPTKNIRFPLMHGQSEGGGMDKAAGWKERFIAWGKLHPEGLGYFGYYYPPGYSFVADTAAADYLALAEMGGYYAHTEGYPKDEGDFNIWDADGVEKWIMVRTMWDPAQDPAVLRKSYITRVYREAAPHMQAFYKLVGEAWHNEKNDFFANCHASMPNMFKAMFVDTGLEEKALALLKEARAAAKQPVTLTLTERALQQFKQTQKSLGRRVVPYVEEAAAEWADPTATHWEKALLVKDFKKVDDWRTFDRKIESEHPTEVRIMYAHDMLYLKIKAEDDNLAGIIATKKSDKEVFPNGDRIEILFRDSKNKNTYIAVGPTGNRYSRPTLSPPSWRVKVSADADSWTAVIAIPLSAFTIDPSIPELKFRLGRVYRLKGNEREESSFNGHSFYNQHGSLWGTFNFETKE